MQVGFDDAEIETLTGWIWLTVMMTGAEVTKETGVQGEFEVIWQVTESPFAGK
jgi:hypothetical protein